MAGSRSDAKRRYPMKLLRYGPAGQEKPGLLDRDGKVRDLSGMVRDIEGEALAPASLDRLRRCDPRTPPLGPGAARPAPCPAPESVIRALSPHRPLHDL